MSPAKTWAAKAIGLIGMKAIEMPTKYRAGAIELGRLANREEEN